MSTKTGFRPSAPQRRLTLSSLLCQGSIAICVVRGARNRWSGESCREGRAARIWGGAIGRGAVGEGRRLAENASLSGCACGGGLCSGWFVARVVGGEVHRECQRAGERLRVGRRGAGGVRRGRASGAEQR